MTKSQKFRSIVNEQIVLMDGALGTYFINTHPDAGEAEEVNLTHPEWIKEIHEEYIAAGARVIRTNTFAVNHMLFPEVEDCKQVIRAAVQIARDAVDESEQEVFIAGSIGPIRQEVYQSDQELLSEYEMLVTTFIEAGIELFVLETFAQTRWVKEIARLIKAQNPEAFILSEFSLSVSGYTKFGYSMEQIITEFTQSNEIDAFGFNCGVGAAHMAKLLKKVAFPNECLFSALPNAGYQQELRGRLRYSEDPAYYAKQMEQVVESGVNLIGGCCGTTPKHIAALSKMLELKSKKEDHNTIRLDDVKSGGQIEKFLNAFENSQIDLCVCRPYQKSIKEMDETTAVVTEPNPFIDKLLKGEEKVFVVELDSPFDVNITKFEQGAHALKANGVDMVTVSDSPMARARADATMMALRMKEHSELTVMPHIACRDRNLIGLRSLILGAHINGVRNLLLITGDPVAKDDRGMIKGVFDVNSIRLMEYVKNMNQEVFASEPIYYGGALNYSGANPEAIAVRMEKKIEQGCSYFLTQPIFSKEDIDRIKWLKERVDTKIICGLMPLVSYKNALFMHNEMPGIHVSDEVLAQYSANMSREEAEQVAVKVSLDIAKELYDVADGFYIMTPFQRVGLVNRIISAIRELK